MQGASPDRGAWREVDRARRGEPREAAGRFASKADDRVEPGIGEQAGGAFVPLPGETPGPVARARFPAAAERKGGTEG